MFEKVPMPVKVISLFNYISAIACVFISVLFFFGYANYDFVFENILSLRMFDIESSFNYGVIFALTGVLVFFIANGLWNGKNWARVLEIFLALTGFVIAIFFVVFGEKIFIFNIFIHGLIGGYLLFSRNVREAFY